MKRSSNFPHDDLRRTLRGPYRSVASGIAIISSQGSLFFFLFFFSQRGVLPLDLRRHIEVLIYALSGDVGVLIRGAVVEYSRADSGRLE